MSTEHNKAIIRSFFSALEDGNLDALSALIDENAQWWVQGKGSLSKQEFYTNTGQILAMTAQRTATIQRIIAEDNLVHANVSTRFVFNDGRILNNTMSLSVEMNEGLIIDSTEFMDVDSVRAFFAGA